MRRKVILKSSSRELVLILFVCFFWGDVKVVVFIFIFFIIILFENRLLFKNHLF